MAAQTLGKALSIFGISPSVVEVFFVDHEEQVNKAKFADHLATQGISYDTDDEYSMRLSIFVENDKDINEINSSQEDYTVGHNHLSTYTEDELKEVMGHIPEMDELKDSVVLEESSNPSKNWVLAGMVNAIQNQKRCGSCWAFSSIAALESAHAIAGNPLIKLSEQQLVNCAAGGCKGGGYMAAFDYAKINKIAAEKQVPYTAKTQNCNQVGYTSAGLVQLSDYQLVTSKSVSQLKAAINQQPVGITIDASGSSFKYYKRGILNKNCGNITLNHAVTAVGYGTAKDGQDFVIVRNSWGQGWGNKGYILVALNDKDICGMMMRSFYPIV